MRDRNSNNANQAKATGVLVLLPGVVPAELFGHDVNHARQDIQSHVGIQKRQTRATRQYVLAEG